MSKQSYSQYLQQLAVFNRCMSHPARVQILQVLGKHGNLSVKELLQYIPLSQPTLSQHLKALLEEKFICRTVKGTYSYYCLEWNRVEKYMNLFERFLGGVMEHRPSRNCC